MGSLRRGPTVSKRARKTQRRKKRGGNRSFSARPKIDSETRGGTMGIEEKTRATRGKVGGTEGTGCSGVGEARANREGKCNIKDVWG